VRRVAAVPRAATRANPGGLTGRELDVLALLSEGLRNREIAARLYVSEKTVGHHVSAILRKLAVPTRGQAAAEAARFGIGKR
jgi:DNA-binding CsgD family transcriptional regulator